MTTPAAIRAQRLRSKHRMILWQTLFLLGLTILQQRVPLIDGKVHLTAPLRDGIPAAEGGPAEAVTVTISDLVSRVPFVDNRGRMYTGTRSSMAVSIDSRTGRVLQQVSGDQCSDPADDDKYVVWLGRVDQSVSIQEPRRGLLDVRFAQGRIISINDMVLGSGQQWHSQQEEEQPPPPFADNMLPPGEDKSKLGFVVATPSGVLAYHDQNELVWMLHEFLHTPVAFAVDAASGTSVSVRIVPDAAVPGGSDAYILSELDRQLHLPPPVGGETIIGSLSSGQLYALPLGHPVQDSGGPGNGEGQSFLEGVHRPGITSGRDGAASSCVPGNPLFPTCLYDENSYVPLLEGGNENAAIVPVFHPEFGYIPPYYNVAHKPNGPKKVFLKIFESWLPPTIALIFVLSFELGRRKRQRDRQLREQELASGAVPDEGGVIQVYDEILGYGGHGTVVYKGMLDGRQVAVKRMLKTYHANADREISLLIESDGHANVVRYFLKEVRGDFVYLALELCDLSLHDLIGALPGGKSTLPSTRLILSQIANGVRHLHKLRIVHRDLKPANILLADSRNQKSKNRRETTDESTYEIFRLGLYVAKISDMGLGKQLTGHSSFGASLINESFRGMSTTDNKPSVAGAGPGSVGWQAPEVMAQRLPSDASAGSASGGGNMDSVSDSSPADGVSNVRTSRSVDIFSLGCIFYSTLVPGSHPFGEWYEREANIMHNRPKIDDLKDISMDAHDMIVAMIHRDPGSRPTAVQMCEHPFFWSAERRLSFLCEFSDRLEMDYDVATRSMTRMLAVENGASQIVGTSWDHGLDPELVSNVQRFRTYDPSTVRDLLRLMRNKHHHFDEMSETLKKTLRSKTEGLLDYFERRFPQLLIHCYCFCREHLAVEDPLRIKYNIVQYGSMRRLPRDAVASQVVKEEDEVDPVDTSWSVVSPKPIRSKIPEDRVIVEDEGEELIDTSAVGDVIIWHGSAAAQSLHCRGWNRSDEEWVRRVDASLRKRDANLERCARDPKFRTRLCNHWDVSFGTGCPMRKKNKCVFAHGPIELRVKDSKRNRWCRLVDANGDCKNPRHSGGEDTYGTARLIETTRKQEGKWNTDKPKGFPSNRNNGAASTGNKPPAVRPKLILKKPSRPPQSAS